MFTDILAEADVIIYASEVIYDVIYTPILCIDAIELLRVFECSLRTIVLYIRT